MTNQIPSLSSRDVALDNLEIIEQQEKFIMYLVDVLLNEYSTYRKIDSQYRLRQSNAVLHNLKCWYEDSPEKPFNPTLLDVYDDSGSMEYLDNRINETKKKILELIRSKL